MKTGIIVAMESERRMLLDLLPEKKEETANGRNYVLSPFAPGHELIITRGGIGKVNAAVAATELIRTFAPDQVISTGVAGGAAPDVKPLDIVAAARTAYHDVYCGPDSRIGQVQGMPEEFPADAGLLAAAVTVPGVRTGLVVTGDWFVDTEEKAREILSLYPDAAAIDMESCAIAQVCLLYRRPFISFRVISDNPLLPLHREQYGNFWEKLAGGSLNALVEFLKRTVRPSAN